MKNNKPTLGVFSFSGCSGCQIAVLNLEDILADLLTNFTIKYFHIIQANNDESNVDVAIIEGSISTKEQEAKLLDIRKKSKILIAMGSCACTGGIQAMKNDIKREELKNIVYGKGKNLKTIKSQGIDKFVKVDFQIKGCPITKEEFAEAVLSILSEKHPFQRPYPMCTECKIKENECLAKNGEICLGPVTYMGCGAKCPTEGEPCTGCRDLFDDARIQAFVKLLKEKKFSNEVIIEKIDQYLSDRIEKKEIERYLK